MNDSSVTQGQDAAEMQMQDPNLVIPTSLHQRRVKLLRLVYRQMNELFRLFFCTNCGVVVDHETLKVK